MIQLFYSNPKTPHHMNIMDDGEDSEHYKVFSGKEFIKDGLSKNMRNKRLLQTVLVQISNYCVRYPDPECVKTLIEGILTEFIIKRYFGEIYQKTVCGAMRLNKEYLESLKMKTIPEYQFQNTHLNTSVFKQQLNQYRQLNTQITEHWEQLENIELDQLSKMFAEKTKPLFNFAII